MKHNAPTIHVPMVAIDGGPGSGKTTGLVVVPDRSIGHGFCAGVVPETATFLIVNGITPKNIGHVEFQRQVVAMQLAHEEYFKRQIAIMAEKLGKKPVLFCDRSVLSGAAYLTEDGDLKRFQKEILQDFDLTVERVRARYAGVIHMVTAADGAEEYYTTANNMARTETPEEARILDKKLQHIWLGAHPRIVANRTRTGEQIPFSKKIDMVMAEALSILGHPVPLEIEDKYLLKAFHPSQLPVKYEAITIEQIYLVSDGVGEERLRKRTYAKSSAYFYTHKKPALDGVGRIEIERSITKGEYFRLLERADTTRQPIKKIRYCFLWEGQYFEIDVFSGANNGLILAEREKTDQNDTTSLPSFLFVDRDVTNDPQYKNSALALTA